MQAPNSRSRHYHRVNEDHPHELWNNPSLPVTYFATASLIENWIDETENRSWFLYEILHRA
jgi:hypothetical protein